MRITSCCGCCSVRTGVLTIGYFSILSCLLTIVMTSVYSIHDMNGLIKATVQIICAIMLIIGVQRRDSKFVFPILCVFFTNLISDIPIGVAQFIRTSMLETKPLDFYIVGWVTLVISYPLLAYFFIVIYTFYKTLSHEKYAKELTGKF